MAAKLEPVLTIADLDSMPEDGNRYELIIRDYWIVDPVRLAIQIYRTSKLRLVATLGIKDKITTPLLPGFRCSVRGVFNR